jgi:hypothetical protein
MAEANDYMLKVGRDERAAKSERQRQAWEEKRKCGVVIYCLRSALFIGAIGFIFHAWPDLFAHQLPLKELLLKSKEATAAGFLTGFTAGLWEWSSSESTYRNAHLQQLSINNSSQGKSGSSHRGTLNGNIY